MAEIQSNTRATPQTHRRHILRLRVGWRREAIIDVYNILLGAMLAISPWLFGFTRDIARADAWAAAAIIVTVSLLAVTAFAEWEEWINIAVGGWLIVSPWVLGFTHTHAMFVIIAIGALVAYDAALELWVVRTRYLG
ncbi:SPW repeat protein [Xanthobacteraceae bacterium Astr-EGSB]|uniref:SPW repeat protein n=1 Tax=Astrobacterium formosum TaxID=3069710 RepID=UPI0027B101C5|nr:SPW repeat protein [Xanthobacteraceae bacterium Astr-EGSB]